MNRNVKKRATVTAWPTRRWRPPRVRRRDWRRNLPAVSLVVESQVAQRVMAELQGCASQSGCASRRASSRRIGAAAAASPGRVPLARPIPRPKLPRSVA